MGICGHAWVLQGHPWLINGCIPLSRDIHAYQWLSMERRCFKNSSASSQALETNSNPISKFCLVSLLTHMKENNALLDLAGLDGLASWLVGCCARLVGRLAGWPVRGLGRDGGGRLALVFAILVVGWG